MRKVTTINLNNNAYQIDEEGYDALREYLSAAERNLEGNPDRAEILADLEQAIGDKCRASLGAHKTVVSAEDIRRILLEMGPVEPTSAGAAGAASANGSAHAAGASGFPRRLYRIEEGRMWTGVCTGLAAYFGVDVVWVRLAFILFTLATGVAFIVYIAMYFIVPVAETAEERAAAQGAPFNARELMDRVKKNSRDFRPRRHRMNRGSSWWASRSAPVGPAPAAAPAPGYAARITGGLLLPVFTVLSAAWFTAMLLAAIAIWNSNGVFGYDQWRHGPYIWTHGVPRWVVVLALLAIWSLIAMPIGAARRASVFYANGGRSHGWAHAWSGVLWLALVCVTLTVAWQFVPGVQEAIRQFLQWAQFSSSYV